MATINATTQWAAQATTQSDRKSLQTKWATFMESQSDSKTLWFLISLVFQGVFFLPVPAVLIYYFNAPILVMVFTLTLFFANIIAGMGGAGIKTLLRLFAVSILIHVLMLIIFIL